MPETSWSERSDRIEQKLDNLSTTVDGLSARVDGLSTRVDGFSASVDARFEQVDTRFASVDKRFDEMREEMDVDSLGFQTIEGLVAATGLPMNEFCLACFNNDYPTAIPLGTKLGCAPRRLLDTSSEAYESLSYPLTL